MKFSNKINNKSGYSLVEMLFYISIFVLLFLVIINSFITLINSFKQIALNQDLIQATQIVETISREIKLSNSSTIENEGETLILQSRIEPQGGAPFSEGDYIRKITFTKVNDNIILKEKLGKEDEIIIGRLNSSNIEVASLSFKHASKLYEADVNSGISFEIEFTAVRFGIERSMTFYNTLVLRGSYAGK